MISPAKSIVLNHIWNNPGTHRREIASHYGLHPNLVSDAVRALIKERWVMEGESKKTSVGRAPIALYLDPNNRAAVAVVYTHDSMTCGLINTPGEVVRSTAARHSLRRPEEIISLAAGQIAKLRRGYKGTIVGLGAADPGMIDYRKNEVSASSSFPDWHDVPMARMFQDKINLETVLMDVSHARAMVQYRLLAERRQAGDTMLYIDYNSNTVGFTFMTPQGIWRGGGFAGEVGHVMVDPKGSLCRCGARGCLENEEGMRALESKATALSRKDLHSVLMKSGSPRAADIFNAAKNGDRFARTVVRDTLDHLGLCAAVVVAMLHPRLLVVGSETGDAISVLAGEMRAELDKRLLPEIASTITVIEGRSINPLGLIGAGLMVFERIINALGK